MTVSESIAAYVDAQLQNLIADTNGADYGQIRSVEEKYDVIFDVSAPPAVHYVIGDEVPADVEEDTEGYTLEFPLWIKIGIAEQKNPFAALRYFTGRIQSRMESSGLGASGVLAALQMDGNVNWVRYQGYQDFAKVITAPVSARVLKYLVQYRRKRGIPENTY